MARGKKTGGRVAGVPNKNTKAVKDVFAATFTALQRHPKANLTKWAKDNPTEFYKLATKLIPVQLTGEEGGPIQVATTVFQLDPRFKEDGKKD